MPKLASFAETGMSGVLESTLPPITVPAWTSMLTGRDPGELGLYGFHNRQTPSRPDLVRADARWVRYPRLWELLDERGRATITVGMPQTSPVRRLEHGALVCGFEGPIQGSFFWPPELVPAGEGCAGFLTKRLDVV